MSKVITSPVKRWPGTVTIADPLTFPQIIAFQDALDVVGALDKPNEVTVNNAMIPGILACVEAWALEGFPQGVTQETFPASKASLRLINWLTKEIVAVYKDEEDNVPLAG